MKRFLLPLLSVLLMVGVPGCSIVDGFLVSVNISGLGGRYRVNPGTNPNYAECTTVASEDYLNPDFEEEIDEVSIYDIRVHVEGTYSGTISNGVVTASTTSNPTPRVILRYQGSWDTFRTPQSLLQALRGNNPNITPTAGAIGFLMNAVRQQEDITVCSSGTVSSTPVPDGLYVVVRILGQVRVRP